MKKNTDDNLFGMEIETLDGMPEDMVGVVSKGGISAIKLTKGVIKCDCGGATFIPIIKKLTFNPEKEDVLLTCSSCGKELLGNHG